MAYNGYNCVKCGNFIETRVFPSNGICPDCRDKPEEKEDFMNHITTVQDGIPILVWADRAKVISEIIDLKIREVVLSKKIGFPIKDIINESWIKMAADKLKVPVSMIRNEFNYKIKESDILESEEII